MNKQQVKVPQELMDKVLTQIPCPDQCGPNTYINRQDDATGTHYCCYSCGFEVDTKTVTITFKEKGKK